jgi:transcriptional regulator with XRE-family HTH domain
MVKREQQFDSFGRCLIYARQRRDMTAEQLSKRSGINASQISHFETDKREPSAANIRKLATALDITADYLLGLSRETRRINEF